MTPQHHSVLRSGRQTPQARKDSDLRAGDHAVLHADSVNSQDMVHMAVFS